MYKKIKTRYNWGRRYITNSQIIKCSEINKKEIDKAPQRTEIINFLLQSIPKTDATYLEIGVRDPEHNFNHINAQIKYSVDPGVEFEENPVDFKMTSDSFFDQLNQGNILSKSIQFDVVFIDGLHLASQVQKDIDNALKYLSPEGFVVLHDCNPPSEWHAREDYYFDLTPAQQFWNGTTWKAFVESRKRADIFSCCIDSDWGVGIISKTIDLGPSNQIENPYFEFHIFEQFRTESLNLISFENLKKIVQND